MSLGDSRVNPEEIVGSQAGSGRCELGGLFIYFFFTSPPLMEESHEERSMLSHFPVAKGSHSTQLRVRT